MKNNLELFIKYIDDDLLPEERNFLEKELNLNSELKNEFEHFSQLYTSTKDNISVDDRYFTTLIPNAKKKMLQTRPIWKNRYALILPIILVGLVSLLVLPINNSDSIIINDLIEIASSNDEIADDIISLNELYFTDDQILSEFYDIDLILDRTVFDYLEENISSSEINDDLFDSFSESEFNNIYEQLYAKNEVGIK